MCVNEFLVSIFHHPSQILIGGVCGGLNQNFSQNLNSPPCTLDNRKAFMIQIILVRNIFYFIFFEIETLILILDFKQV